MKLARIFQDNMILQRNKVINIWGESDVSERVLIKIDGCNMCEVNIPKGSFSIELPPQSAKEGILIEIGEIKLQNVDIGEVWFAGGQSNMEFMLQYARDGALEIEKANDLHLRIYTVGQYSFKEQREEHLLDWHAWDQWLSYESDYAKEFPAVAVYFAKELRKAGIPVGIINCTWGGTSASTWVAKQILESDEALFHYIKEYNQSIESLDMDRYYKINKLVRQGMSDPKYQEGMSSILKYTFKPEVLMRQMTTNSNQNSNAIGDVQTNTDDINNGEVDIRKLSIQEINAIGPNDKNRPSALFENMVSEVLGYSIKGIIWYQGESDDKGFRPYSYDKLFTRLIESWRDLWKDELPFLFVQLAPYGTWMQNPNTNFPLLRNQQEKVSKSMSSVYMASISDIGNVYDIHPKEKKLVGERLALLAKKYVYGDTQLLADAPEVIHIDRFKERISLVFKYGDGLYIKDEKFENYNGFDTESIEDELLPTILDGINALDVYVDYVLIKEAKCYIENDHLIIQAFEIASAKRIRVELANCGFYQVNLFNTSGIPAKPFVIELVDI